jgi:hypothetical protein
VASSVIWPRPLVAQGIEAVEAVLRIVQIIDELDLGDLARIPLLGPNDCRTMERCERGLRLLRAVRQLKTPSSINNYEAWMASSDNSANCGSALLGGNISRFNELWGALAANVQNCCNGNWQADDEYVSHRGGSDSGGGDTVLSQGGASGGSSSKCISNPWLGKFLGVHENGQLVMWPGCSGGGEKWEIQSNGCIFNPWLNKYLGVHENGQLVMWPRCSGGGEKWEIQ